MGSYTMISDISGQLKEELRALLVPELLTDPGEVELCSPEEKEEVSLSIFLYDIQECEEIRQVSMIDMNEKKQRYPPVFLTLYYMITAYSQSDIKFKKVQEERLLGRIIQYFHDHSFMEFHGEAIRIQMLRISTEDKIKLWNFNGKPYSVSVFYKLSPVLLESAMTRDVIRVKETKFGVEPKQHWGKK